VKAFSLLLFATINIFFSFAPPPLYCMVGRLSEALQPTAKSLLNMNKKSSILHAMLFAGFAASVSAAVLEKPPLASGAKSIDPKGIIAPELAPANFTFVRNT
jgi:hypothetical protein